MDSMDFLGLKFSPILFLNEYRTIIQSGSFLIKLKVLIQDFPEKSVDYGYNNSAPLANKIEA